MSNNISPNCKDSEKEAFLKNKVYDPKRRKFERFISDAQAEIDSYVLYLKKIGSPPTKINASAETTALKSKKKYQYHFTLEEYIEYATINLNAAKHYLQEYIDAFEEKDVNGEKVDTAIRQINMDKVINHMK